MIITNDQSQTECKLLRQILCVFPLVSYDNPIITHFTDQELGQNQLLILRCYCVDCYTKILWRKSTRLEF